MSKINNNNEAAEKVEVGEALTRTEKFLQTYKNQLVGGVIALVVIVAGGLAYHHFISLPAQQEAQAQTFTAEFYFRNGDFEKALNGDGNTLGFKQIISDYGTKAGESVYFYAGVCELQLCNYQNAIDYLKKYNSEDNITAARALCNIGDSYVGLGNYKEALGYFTKAADLSNDIFSAAYLLKAGLVNEELGDKVKAIECYTKIKEKYPQSIEGMDIDKYIERLQ